MHTFTLVVKDGRKVLVRMVGITFAAALEAISNCDGEIVLADNPIIELRKSGTKKVVV